MDELNGAMDGWIMVGKSELKVRAILVPLSTGELEILITNLTESEMEYEAFGELYHMR